MALAKILLKLWKLRLFVAVGVVLATAAAVVSVKAFHSAVYASASTEMLVDSPQSALADAETDLTGYTARAVVFSRLMTSPQVLQYIGRAAGIPGNMIAATGPVEVNGSPNTSSSPTADQNGRVVSVATNYKLNFVQNPELPTVDVYAQAPTTKQAIALADGAVNGFAAFVSQLNGASSISVGKRITIRQLGAATGGVVDPSASKSIAGLIFVAVLLLWCAALLFVNRLRGQLRTVSSPEAVGTSTGPDAVPLDYSAATQREFAPFGADGSHFADDPGYSGTRTGDGGKENGVSDGVRLRP